MQLLFLFYLYSSSFQLNPIDARSLGAIPNDTINDTEPINQALLRANGRPVLISGGIYLIDAVKNGIQLLDNSNLIIDSSAKIKALTNSSGVYSILTIRNKKNVRIEGKGTIEGDRNTHRGDGEYGMCITIYKSSNVSISGLTIKNAWGDNIYVGGGVDSSEACMNISIEKIRADSGRRQGLSITNVRGMKVSRSKFNYSNGTSPQSGIDIEPNMGNIVYDLTIEDCEANYNSGSGIIGYLSEKYKTSFIKSISIKNVSTNYNLSNGILISSALPNHFRGFILTNFNSEFNGKSGLYLNNVSEGRIENLFINNSSYYCSIGLGNTSNIYIRNCRIRDTITSNPGISFLGINSNVSLSDYEIKVNNYGLYAGKTAKISGLNIYGDNIITSGKSKGIFIYNIQNSSIKGKKISQLSFSE